MKFRQWIKFYPFTAVCMACWLAGGSYFGSTEAWAKADEVLHAPQLTDQMGELSEYEASPVTLTAADAQKTSEEKAAADAAEAERKAHPFSQVDQSYLDDALFIGDSRTDTLRLYAGWDNATYYVKTGTNVWEILSLKVKVGKKTMTIEQALKKKKFGKIYIMLGINEIGTGSAKDFYKQYKSVVKRIRELQPDAILFVQSIMHVTAKVSDSDKTVTNERIDARNKLLAKLADNDMIYYIDENEALDDENHCLTAKYTYDGVHLEAKYVQPWKDFILAHGVVKDTASETETAAEKAN